MKLRVRRLCGVYASLLVSCLLYSAGVPAQVVTLRLATQTLPGTAQYDGASKFAELVAKKSSGKLAVKVFGDGALGGDLQVISSLQRGSVEISLMNASLLNGVAKEFAILDFPFLFDSEEEAYSVLDGPIGQRLIGVLPAKGIVGLSYPELGFRHIHNSRHPVTRLEDLQGLKIRTVQTPIYVETLSALGANAVPLPFPDLYHVLEKKVVDGATDPLVTIDILKFDEVQRYLTLTRHVYNPQIFLVSKITWDKLSSDERATLQDAANDARDFERKLSKEKNAQALEKLKKTMQLSVLSPQETEKMRQAVRPVIQKYTKVVGEELVGETNAALVRLRGKKPI
jgi:tripartite ATP-independent transporter DctP family solute receptor